MKPPAGLLGTALLFWGYMIGQPIVGLAGAVVLEGSRFLSWRWDLTEREITRLWDACLMVAAMLMAYFLVLRRGDMPSLAFAQWLPAAFFPVVLAQHCWREGRITWRVLFVLARRKPIGASSAEPIQLGYPYFVLCLYAAGAVNRRDLIYFTGCAILTGWALWGIRSRRQKAFLWIPLFGLAAATAFGLQVALAKLQELADWKMNQLFSGRGRPDGGEHNKTSIGELGQLKLSNRILMWVQSEHGDPPLLRTASFSTYREGTWLSAGSRLNAVNVAEGDVWTLRLDRRATNRLSISGFLGGSRRSYLSTPLGLAELSGIPAVSLETNSYGVVRLQEAPSFLEFQLTYSARAVSENPCEIEDLAVPAAETPAVEHLVRVLDLSSNSVDQALIRIARLFETEFRYSTSLAIQSGKSGSTNTALTKFLLETKSGHCEYFASAATLLLRQAGIPARYSTGFSVQEESKPGLYLVRDRHAHAWCQVLGPEGWKDFDPTPPGWAGMEASAQSWMVAVTDFLSSLWYHFTRWRYQKSGYQEYVIWAFIPLAVGLFLSVVWRHVRREKVAPAPKRPPTLPVVGEDSEFYLVEKELLKLGTPRYPSEPLRNWLERLKPLNYADPERMEASLALHYRLRFDPAGLSPMERSELQDQANQLVAQLTERRGRGSA